jgi:hypothetical protein
VPVAAPSLHLEVMNAKMIFLEKELEEAGFLEKPSNLTYIYYF